jgi:Ca-activated chloride channel family protein
MKRITALFALLLAATIPAGLAAQAVSVTTQLDQTRFLAGQPGKAYLKVGLTGRESTGRARPALNVAIVLDRSGSMEGEKLERAKDAAKYAVSLLKKQDILSIVVYDTEVSVLLPATKVSDTGRINRLIDGIEAGDSTALFAGVSKGAAELRKFLDRDQVNRVILLSDGLANVGPDSPQALADLGRSLRREGISVTTLGLGSGYNEDLMARLAGASDGNHAFVESPRDLVRIFDAEFRDAMSIAALDVQVRIDCAAGVVPLRIMNRDGDIRGASVQVNLNQVLASQEKYVLVELQLPAGKSGQNLEIATAQVSFRDQASKAMGSVKSSAAIAFTSDAAVAEKSVQKDVKSEVVLQLATEANEKAVKLRDEGKVEQARQALQDNAAMLKGAAAALSAPGLAAYADKNEAAAGAMDSEDWNSQRKEMVQEQYQNKTQQTY